MCKLANGADLSAGYFGGLDWDLLIFNWHPVLMTSFVACGAMASVSWILSPFPRVVTKIIHAMLHACGVVFLSVGLHAVLQAHGGQNASHAYYANLSSVHSWVGLGAIVLYLFNYLLGLLRFVIRLGSESSIKAYLPSHKSIGLMSLFLGFAAMVAGLTEMGYCDRPVTKNDINPATEYMQLTVGCRLGNGAAMSLLASVVCAGFAIIAGTDVGESKRQNEKKESGGVFDDGFDEYLLNRG
jgi:hypothetical protein